MCSASHALHAACMPEGVELDLALLAARCITVTIANDSDLNTTRM
jgi:hypothetical protein